VEIAAIGVSVSIFSAILVLCCTRLILTIDVENGEDEYLLRPGDLVALISSFDGRQMDECPPGLVLEVAHGQPSTGYIDEPETMVCSILWRGFIDEWVSSEWLVILII